ncbi:MAG: septum site-determining protein MinC [Deinococcales bacterium]
MRIKGTRGGISLVLEPRDSGEFLAQQLSAQAEALKGMVFVEHSGRVAWEVLEQVSQAVKQAGGILSEVRSSDTTPQQKRETKIIARTVRSGGRVEASGSAIVLGDVNAGAEIIASDDIVVVGKLRGLAHAGVQGNEQAVIWAQSFENPQMRIAQTLLEDSYLLANKDTAIVHLVEGRFQVTPWEK